MSGGYIVGLDNGGTANKFTVMDTLGHYLVDELIELPSRVDEGPGAALAALQEAFDAALSTAGITRDQVIGVGFDSPGPASADGVLSSRGATNFSAREWWGFDFRTALERLLEIPVVYSNDTNAAALYAHYRHFGPVAGQRSSVAAIVGTGLGGGVIHDGATVKGAAGMAGELGHVHIPTAGLLHDDQPMPRCNCGFDGDAESFASLTGIRQNLLPYWLTRYPDHPLHEFDIGAAAKQVRSYAEDGDEMALAIFEQQAAAIGRLFTIMANVIDPDVYFVGGGVLETVDHFREWFVGRVREHTMLRQEQADIADILEVTHLDMAGARGAAVAALSVLGH